MRRKRPFARRPRIGGRRSTAICGMTRTAVFVIMTGAVNSRRCFLPPASSPCTSALQPMSRRNALPMRYGPACLPPGGIMPPNTKAASSGIKPNGWRRCSGWRSRIQTLRPGSAGDEIAWSWLQTVNHFYKQHHKLIEKYHIATGVPHEGGGGEYPLQDGFGWTNGVVRRLIGSRGANLVGLSPAAVSPCSEDSPGQE